MAAVCAHLGRFSPIFSRHAHHMPHTVHYQATSAQILRNTGAKAAFHPKRTLCKNGTHLCFVVLPVASFPTSSLPALALLPYCIFSPHFSHGVRSVSTRHVCKVSSGETRPLLSLAPLLRMSDASAHKIPIIALQFTPLPILPFFPPSLR